MSKTGKYRIVTDLVLEALDLSPEERTAFLDRECADDEELREEVESLLEEDERIRTGQMPIIGIVEAAKWHAVEEARQEDGQEDGDGEGGDSGPSEESAADGSEEDHGSPLRPSRIGPYRILDVLGEGGMGMVYLAEQAEPIERLLALKLSHTNLRNPRAALRFEAERKAMARLSHPHIAQMVEAGTTEDGFPYFVMELLREAMPITDFCDHHQLSIDGRLGLFAKVCRAVHHAHQRGILHRDLKPANILVIEGDTGPVPKVIDFGLAKALDRPLTGDMDLTGRQVIGTMAYLSPESFSIGEWEGEDGERVRDVDTRSDVYALGVILYELLCGRLPFRDRTSSLGAMIERKVKEDATAPSARLSSSLGSPDSEIAERRRLSVVELSRRLSEELDWVVLKAVARNRDERYPSAHALAEELDRYLRGQPLEAHPPTTTYRVRKLVGRHRGAFLAGALIALALVLGTIGTTVGMIRAHNEAERAQAEAERARLALAESEELTRFLTELFRAADPYIARRQNAQELLDRGAAELEARFSDQPRIRGRMLQKIASLYITLGLFDQAAPLVEEARTLTDRVFPGPTLENADVAVTEGRLDWNESRFDAAEAHYRSAIAIYGDLLGPEAPATLDTRHRLANSLILLDRFDEAEDTLRDLLAIHERLHGPDHPDVARDLGLLGRIHFERRENEEALACLEQQAAILRKALGPDHPGTMASYADLARSYRQLGRYEDAEREFLKALRLTRRYLGEEHNVVASRLLSLGVLYQEQERFEEAETAFAESLVIWEKAHGPDNLDVSRALNNLGTLYWRMERYAEAEPLYERSLLIKEKNLPPNHSSLGYSINNLGLIYWKRADFARAETYLQRAADIWRESHGPDHALLAWPLWGLAGTYRDQGRFEDAEPLYLRAIELRERHLYPGHPDLLETRDDYAEMLRAMGREEEARALEARFPDEPPSGPAAAP